jgi:SAM-dependent MidA family methyltransferase
MASALYDADNGYYTKNIRTVGRRGDFSTSATLSDSLAKGIARWLKSSIRETGIRHVIEIGAGDGSLARDIFKSLGFLGRSSLSRYTVVDISDPLIRLQKENLSHLKKVHWVKTMPEALAHSAGHALIFSNENVDAFPAQIFRKTETGWEKLHLSPGENFLPAHDLPPSCIFDYDWPTGQRVEVHDSYRQWLVSWASNFKKGRMLAIDYGDTSPAIYHRRPHGSLRAYFHQTLLEGIPEITQNKGKQDITAEVNFDDLQNWGTIQGLKTTALTTQQEFLAQQGIDTHHLGSGTAFKALVQQKSD